MTAMPARPRKRGSILVLALIVSAVASIAGMHLMIVADLRMRRSHALARVRDAGRVALSGLQYARIRLGSNPGYAGGTLQDPVFTSATFNLDVDAAGVLKAHASSVGTYSDATSAVNADLRAPAHPVLDYNIYSSSTIVLQDATLKGYLRANGNVTAVGDIDFFGAVATTSGSTVTNQIASGQIEFVTQSLAMPTLPFTSYTTIASAIVNAPIESNHYVLTAVSFRPNYNPYGAVNARGAYVLDAGGKDVDIADIYVDGTLIIKNAGLVKIERGCRMKASDPSLATLLVQGALTAQLQDDLKETGLVVDMNGDGDMTDIFEPLFEGVVAVSGAFTGTNSGTFKGCLMASSVTIIGYPRVEKLQTFTSTPVEGFTVPGPWNILAGSIQSGGG